MNFKLLCIFSLITLIANAQTPTFNDDAAIWQNIYLEKRFNEKIDLHINQQNRFNNNVSDYNLSYADMGITWHVNKNIRLLGDYVLINRRKSDGSYGLRHQGYVALVLRQKIRRFVFMYRNMLQTQVTGYLRNPETGRPSYSDRNKFTIKYELNKRFSFYVAEELFYPLYQAKGKGLNRSRSFAGMFYKLSKKSELEFYFAYQHELNATHLTRRVFIYGIGYAHEF